MRPRPGRPSKQFGPFPVMSTFSLFPAADDYAADVGTSAWIGVSGRLAGSIETSGDADWFRVELLAGATYSIDLMGDGGNPLADPLLGVYNEAGRIIRFNDDASATDLNSHLEFTPVETGVYFLAATSARADLGGDYALSLSIRTDIGGPVVNSFSGNDLLFQDGATGAFSAALLAGTAVREWRPLGQAADGLRLSAVADLNGDGAADLIQRDAEGAVTALLGNRGDEPVEGPVLELPDEWDVKATADFDGDGRGDLVLQHEGGWLFGVLTVGAEGNLWTPVESLGDGWHVVAALDADRDGQQDILLQNQESGVVGSLLLDGLARRDFQELMRVDASLRVAGAGDVTGDGVAELLYQAVETGAYGYLQADGNGGAATVEIGVAGAGWQLVGVADLDLPTYG